jgi:hypothetical protein
VALLRSRNLPLTACLIAALAGFACRREVTEPHDGARSSRPENRVEGASLDATDWQENLAWCPAIDTQVDKTSPAIAREDAVGEWFISQAVPNAGGEWYGFLRDSSYVDIPDVVDCRDRIVARRGIWQYRSGGIEVTELDVVKLKGGTIELEGVSVPSTIVGGVPIRIPLNPRRRFRLEFVVTKNHEEGMGNRLSLRRGDGLQLWKSSSNSDPERAARYEGWSPAVRLPAMADLDADCAPFP